MSDAASAQVLGSATERPLILLAGNPNAGKTTLFNALTGARAKVGNYPGITVDRVTAKLRLPDGIEAELVDLPGCYSLSAQSPEERIAADSVFGRGQRRPSAVVVVVDATALGRSLYLALQIIELGLPVVVALTMTDDALKLGLGVDVSKLSALIGAEVVAVVGPKRLGLEETKSALRRALSMADRAAPTRLDYGPVVERDIERLLPLVAAAMPDASPLTHRAWCLWCLMTVDEEELAATPESLRRAVGDVRTTAKAAERDVVHEVLRSIRAHRPGGAGRATACDR